jgi:TolB-like protein/DNA-binding winged helix-turn-helix (wHTH) protein/Flp pilus assembly protein TadD
MAAQCTAGLPCFKHSSPGNSLVGKHLTGYFISGPAGIIDWFRANSDYGRTLVGLMREFSPSVRSFRFGVFEIDLRAGELRKRGTRIRLQSQPLMLLLALLKQPGEIVTRDELRRTLWPEDTFVDFDHSLGTAVNKIREVLGDSATNPRFIETLPRRGYRFIAPVETVGESEGKPIVTQDPAVKQEPAARDLTQAGEHDPVDLRQAAAIAPRSRPTLRWQIYAFALVLLSAGLFALIIRRIGSPAPIRSLAVLPLENLSGNPSQDYFSDGMTDELITELGQIGELRVISRTSVMTYKGARKPLPQIARELNVDAVVEGTVLRSANRVRITAQLILASTDKHLWAQSYEAELLDVLALQKEVARAIAGQIRIKLNPNEQAVLKQPKAVNAEAYEAYLKGRYFWNKRTGEGLKKAVDYFNRAIGKDPTYAQAYAGLADSYALMGDWEYGVLPPAEAFPKAKAAAAKALALDNTLGEAHTSLAFVLDLFDWDWGTAEKEYRQAVDLSPNYATAHQWYAWHLIVLGRNDEAIAEMRRAKSLDPLSLIIGTDMADALLIARRYDESIRQSRETLGMDPDFAVSHFQLGQAFVQKHMYIEGIAELRKAIGFSGGNKTFRSNLAYAYAASGRKSEALKILDDLHNGSNDGFSHASEIALIHVGLDEKDQAMIWLERAYTERFNPSVLMRPCFDPLRSDPRFQILLRRMGLSR